MPHIVYIDLSAKVEQWVRASAVAMSNGASRTILLTGKEKQRTRRWLSAQYGGKSTQYRLLAALIYLVVKDDLPNIRQVVIDQDYSGHQVKSMIKSLLLELLRRDKPNVTAGFVRFEKVEKSRADILAKKVYDGKVSPDRIVRFAEIKKLLSKK